MTRVKPTVRIYRTFPKIGTHIHLLDTTDDNPRNGEGSFLRLKNGNILFVYTAYITGNYRDDCPAELRAIESSDEGETWSEPRLFYPKPDDALNIMSVSLLRMGNGDFGLFYLRKDQRGEFVTCRPCFVRSSDEGKTFTEPFYTIPEAGRFIVNNDRVIRLSNGSILFGATVRPDPMSMTDLPGFPSVARFFLSDDDGKTFYEPGPALHTPFPGIAPGLQEPGVFERGDGVVMAYFRTPLGCQCVSYSKDHGRTFSDPVPDYRFTSPLSPMLIKTVGPYTVAVFNPIPSHAANRLPFGMDRTPYMISVSDDGGITFPRSYLLEDDLKSTYCYPAVIEVSDGFLVAYYHSGGTEQFLNQTQISKVRFDEIAAVGEG